MRRTSLAVLAGIILTCMTDLEHNEYTSFQVDGAVAYHNGRLEFTDVRGDMYRIDAYDCALFEGTLRAPGADMRGEAVTPIRPVECPGAR